MKAHPKLSCRNCGVLHPARRDKKRLCELCVQYMRKYGVARPIKS
jgi:hypothetical protein